MFGFYNIHKPPGPTSHDIVTRIRRGLPRKTKVGHAGTLDPFAGGVLVVCVGPATRLAERVQQQPKRYTAEVTLGATSTTDDTEGEVSPTEGAAPPQPLAIEAVMGQFVGKVEQTPPAHSAVHVGGRRAYELARDGQTVRLAARTVTIHSIGVVEYAWPKLTIDIRCGSGTYIRSLARDIGRALGVGGYCTALTRTAVGGFTLDGAVSVDVLDAERDLLPALLAVAGLPRVQLDAEDLTQIRQGRPAPCPRAPDAEEAALLAPDGRLAALARISGGRAHPAKVFIA